MWQDDSVVPPYILNTDKGDKVLHRTSETKKGKYTLKTDLFATSKMKKEFVKVVNGTGSNKTIELYRHVGQASYKNEDGEIVSRGTKYIYQRIPKLGVLDNGFRVMELQKQSLEASAFSDNSFNMNALLTSGQIEELALNALRNPKKDSEFTKIFIPGDINSIQINMEQDSKEISGQQDGSPVIDISSNTIDIEDNLVPTDDVIITPEMMQEATDFVYGTIETEDFDANAAIMDFVQSVEDISELTETFGMNLSPQESIIQGTQQSTNIEDMSALVELGKKRKKECE